MAQEKDFLSFESARNRKNARLFQRIIKLAFGNKDQVSIGHHLSFEKGDDIDTLNEIPSADTLIFDHDVMERIFGIEAPEIMASLARLPVNEGFRDSALADYLEKRETAAMGRFIGSKEIHTGDSV